MLGILGSVLFIFAMVLLAYSMEKYKFRTIIIVLIGYALLPNFLITAYQETMAKGIYAISYDNEGNCSFDTVEQDLINGECNFVLHNRSNNPVSFELQFLDINLRDDQTRSESLMNIVGPYRMTIEANHKESIHLEELLDVSEVPNHIDGGTSFRIHFKLVDGERDRIL